jgi:L-amino acid N-acyltransferase YncA
MSHWVARTSGVEVSKIYEAGIATGNVTFELVPPTWSEWDGSHLADQRIVATEDAKVVGWAALSLVSSRCIYQGVAEDSVYVSPNFARLGIGNRLLSALIREAEHAGIWTIQAGIFPENAGSLKLHTNHGFRIVGRRERIGQHHGQWRSTLLLERRSTTVNSPAAIIAEQQLTFALQKCSRQYSAP